MYHSWCQLTLYSETRGSILHELALIWRDFESESYDRDRLAHRLNAQVKRLLDLSTEYGFDGNLWQNYLTFLMVGTVHSFGLACERTGAADGTINEIARADFRLFLSLFHFDFAPLEEALGVRTLSLLQDYRAVPKREQLFNRDISECVRTLSRKIAQAKDENEVFALITEHYRLYGTGLFGMNRAFRVRKEGELVFEPIRNVDHVRLSDLVGYELQKKTLCANLEAFLSGRPFNNTLLYGDAGTGKSTSVKAALNEYWTRGLRVIEVSRYQFSLLSEIIARVKARRYSFVLLLDDLSFDEGDAEYKYLKAVIEGGLETKPDNVMICATSNRRHLIRETWKDRSDMEFDGEIHQSDTVEEKLSLAERFGCSIRFSAPDKALFDQIVRELAARHPEIKLPEQELLALANRWEIRHGGLSGRTAQQFINDLAGRAAGDASW